MEGPRARLRGCRAVRGAPESAWSQCIDYVISPQSTGIYPSLQLDGDWIYANSRMFERVAGTWTPGATIMRTDGLPGNGFLRSVSLSAGRLATGAYLDDDNGEDSGTVFIFEEMGGAWGQAAKLIPPDGAALDRFGYKVVLDGDSLAVAAPGNWLGSFDGRVYMYDRTPSGWVEVAQLTEFGGSQELWFGNEMALDGDTLAISTGSAEFIYMYSRATGTWLPDKRLPLPAASIETALALDGDRLAAGKKWFLIPGGGLGIVRVWTRTAGVWGSPVNLTESDATVHRRLGSSVAFEGDFLYAGVRDNWVSRWRQTPSGWIFVDRFLPQVGIGGELDFGEELDVDGSTVVVGSFSSADTLVYTAPEVFSGFCDCTNWNQPTQQCNPFPAAGCANSTGRGAHLSACGSASLGTDDLVLTIDGLPINQPGILFMGAGTAQATLGGGLLCVGPGSAGLFRYPVQSSGSSGTLQYGPGLGATSQALFPANGHLQPGDTWNFQTWSRDPAGPCGSTSNTSNAIGVLFRP